MNTYSSEAATTLYLDLMKQCLTGTLFPESGRPAGSPLRARLAWAISPITERLPFAWNAGQAYDPARLRREGRDWPREAETMIGLARLDNLQHCVTGVLRDGIPGDLIETGVWRGGACIFMRAILNVYGDRSRTVWVADSFAGLPKPDPRFPQDAGDRHWKHSDVLGVSLDRVKANFERYGLLDAQVRFLEGWFRDTLPSAPIHNISVLRLDGDMYSSTMDALQNLYPKVSPGGYVIVDDYGAVAACKQAVDDYRTQHGIQETIEGIDWTGVFWKKN